MRVMGTGIIQSIGNSVPSYPPQCRMTGWSRNGKLAIKKSDLCEEYSKRGSGTDSDAISCKDSEIYVGERVLWFVEMIALGIPL